MLASAAVSDRLSPIDPDPAAQLLAWYDAHRRILPWRAAPGERPDPYHVWLSEVMLQQTTVATVGPYFRRFIARWPTIAALAAAPLDDVLHAWQGLGYYARGRNLHACTQVLVAEHGGRVPDSEEALRALPGIGAYTAAAIAAIAFGRRTNVVDANVERVIARYLAIEAPLPGAKRILAEAAAGLVPETRSGDYAQALMDLGATVCTPRRPACGLCPWRAGCTAHRAGIAEALPKRAAKRPRPQRHAVAFWLEREDGAILLRRRPDKGLLGGMMELPSTPWRDQPWSLAEARAHAPLRARWRQLAGTVEHGFTHFAISFDVVAARVSGAAEADGLWVPPPQFSRHALPTMTKKLVRHALAIRAHAAASQPNLLDRAR